MTIQYSNLSNCGRPARILRLAERDRSFIQHSIKKVKSARKNNTLGSIQNNEKVVFLVEVLFENKNSLTK